MPITVLPFTWALGKPDAFARRIARNTHLVLQEESSLGRVVDPGARRLVHREADATSWRSKGWALFQDIEAKGGMAARARERVHAGRDRQGRPRRAPTSIATGRLELTGVSAFPRLGDDGVKVEPHPPAEPVVKGGTSVAPLLPRRLAEPFERLRDAADAILRADGQAPAGVPGLPRRSRRPLGALDLDAQFPRRRRHRGRRQRAAAQLGRRRQGVRRQRRRRSPASAPRTRSMPSWPRRPPAR